MQSPTAPPVLRASARAVQRVREALPRGRTLTEEGWRHRHAAIQALLWAHVAGVPVFGHLRGFGLSHLAFEASPIAAAALLASSGRLSRRSRAAAATVGIFTSSAVLVHLSGGQIEMHFHFFVMVAVVALYQDWLPFLLAIAYVLVHHGAMGVIAPMSVYNHSAAWSRPWLWAAVHATFIAGISVVCLVTWRLNEGAVVERDQAVDGLQDTLSVLSATLEATADGILVVNQAGKITTFNSRFVQMWGIPAPIVESRDDARALAYVVDQLVEPEAFLAKVRELYDDPDAQSFDELSFKDGRTFERYSHPHRVGGASVGRVWSFRDVTERKRGEQVLVEAMLRDQQAVERLEALDESKNLLLTAVSHELRTPLTSIVGYAHTIASRDGQLPPDERQKLLGRLVANTERLQALVLDLFDLDRISRGVVTARPVRIDIGRLVTNVVEHLDLGGRPLRVDGVPVEALVDPAMIERVVENLLVNASKHTPAGSPVDVEILADADAVRIVVADRGPGVPDEMKEAVFEPFRQGSTSAHSPGTGIGLSLVAKFADLHGGRAWVEDRIGGGSRFVVSLPCSPSPAGALRDAG